LIALRALSAAQLLEAWEYGQGQSPSYRALALLVATCDEPPELQASLSIGQRDARLLALRELTFGPQLVSVASCPACGAQLELTFSTGDICVQAPDAVGEVAITADGYTLRARLPNSLDLDALARCADAAAARAQLITRCVIEANYAGKPLPAADLPEALLALLAAQMAEADPQADVCLAMSCPDCGHGWQASFDIVSFFWSELEAWVQRTLRDVHTLAWAYGWHEADILALSPWRRRYYLELVRG